MARNNPKKQKRIFHPQLSFLHHLLRNSVLPTVTNTNTNTNTNTDHMSRNGSSSYHSLTRTTATAAPTKVTPPSSFHPVHSYHPPCLSRIQVIPVPVPVQHLPMRFIHIPTLMNRPAHHHSKNRILIKI